jgi:hypothetical protein
MRHVFGFFFNPGVDLSLRAQLRLIRGKTINLNLILVGDNKFSFEDWKEMQYAIQFTRNIYGVVALGVRELRWLGISSDEAGSYQTINSGSEAHDLTDDWNGPDSAFLDVFVVRAMKGADGWSAIGGPCSKDDKDEMTGSVVSLNGLFDNSGNTFAHEIGHYLGLKHISDPDNFIGNDGASNSNTAIKPSQGTTMKKHCLVKDVC